MRKHNGRGRLLPVIPALLAFAISACGAETENVTPPAAADESEADPSASAVSSSEPETEAGSGETEPDGEGAGAGDANGQMAAFPEPEGFEVTEEILSTAMVMKGNPYRLQNVMKRALDGEPVTLAYLGGSITKGAAATSEESCYAALTTQWWRETFPETEITYINAGVGETDSYVGVHRAERDVLSDSPDVVVVEFSVNDEKEINRESYESLLRRILTENEKTAVICLMLGTKTHSFADEHFPIAYYYDLPIINVNGLMANGLISWEQIGTEDGVHPSDEGHALFAGLLTEYCAEVLASVEEGERADPYTIPEVGQSACSYTDSFLIFADDTSGIEVSGLVPEEKEFSKLHGLGWTTQAGETVRMETEAKTFGILYTQFAEEPEGGSASYEIYVDGEYTDTIFGCDEEENDERMIYTECLKEDTASHHVIELRPVSGTGTFFEIRALAVGE